MFTMESLKDLKGFTIQATDGEIGKLDDFYFDDDEWAVRYLVVDTGGWLTGRKVLLSPESISGQVDRENKLYHVDLTRDQVKNSPLVDTERPVSRQQETELRGYYGWPMYWGGMSGPQGGMGYTAVPPMLADSAAVPVTGPHGSLDNELGGATPEEMDRKQDPHLRSFKEVTGYRIHADDGEVGKVSDFIVEDEKWNIMYMVVDTGNLFPGRKVLVAPSWIQAVSWDDKQVDVDLKVDTIKNSPEYDPNAPITEHYEEGLYQHYGKQYHRR